MKGPQSPAKPETQREERAGGLAGGAERSPASALPAVQSHPLRVEGSGSSGGAPPMAGVETGTRAQEAGELPMPRSLTYLSHHEAQGDVQASLHVTLRAS